MNVSIKNFLLSAALLAASISITLPASASGKPKLIVQSLPTDSAIAHNPSQDLLLRTDADGEAYLYLEQQHGALLAVFDVTDPERMKLVATVATPSRGAYNFVAPVGNSELISFRDGSGAALIDLRKPKDPKLSLSSQSSATLTEPLGRSVSLVSSIPPSQSQTAPPLPPRNVQLVEAGPHPRVLVSLTGVTRQVERPKSGTIFLLAEGKVTIVRRLDIEREYEDEGIFPLAREN